MRQAQRPAVTVKVDCNDLGLQSPHMAAIEQAAARMGIPAVCATIPAKAAIVIDANQIPGMQATCVRAFDRRGSSVITRDELVKNRLLHDAKEVAYQQAQASGLLDALKQVVETTARPGENNTIRIVTTEPAACNPRR